MGGGSHLPQCMKVREQTILFFVFTCVLGLNSGQRHAQQTFLPTGTIINPNSPFYSFFLSFLSFFHIIG